MTSPYIKAFIYYKGARERGFPHMGDTGQPLGYSVDVYKWEHAYACG